MVDYAVWEVFQEMVYHCRSFDSLHKLKCTIVTARQQLSEAFLDESIDKWRRRPENVVSLVQYNGGHIEHAC